MKDGTCQAEQRFLICRSFLGVGSGPVSTGTGCPKIWWDCPAPRRYGAIGMHYCIHRPRNSRRKKVKRQEVMDRRHRFRELPQPALVPPIARRTGCLSETARNDQHCRSCNKRAKQLRTGRLPRPQRLRLAA